MLTGWNIFWITRLDSISVVFTILAAIFSLITVISIIIYLCNIFSNLYETIPRFWILPAIVTIITIIFISTATLTPTTKEAVAIYTLPKIANNETVHEISGNAADLVNEQLKAWIDEVRKED